MLVADTITCTRWGKPLFKDLGLCLLYGSLTVLLGRNPAAKEALLNVLAGASRPARGQVRFEGEPVIGNKEFEKLVACIGPKNSLKPRRSVEENIRSMIRSPDAEGLVSAAMHYFKLMPYADVHCGSLPPHLQRRVTYAELLAVPSPIWLLQHSPESLDAEGNELFYMLVSNRCNQDGIVVMATETADAISPNLPLTMDDFI